MSLRHALLDLLSADPQSGYDLAQFFTASMGNVWPAQHSQIYPELSKLVAEGLIEQTGAGPRGRKEYRTTPDGLEELRRWLRDEEPDFAVRYGAMLRVFALWTLPKNEALAQLASYREEFTRHLERIEGAIQMVDWGNNEVARSSRLAIEFGRRFYAAQIEWADWAAEQVAAGALEPGGPLPPSPAPTPAAPVRAASGRGR
jgi:DNA-binding PadR family transcriptional regulator